MLVIPAIDLREGRCVRLYQGRLEDETVFSDDPVAVACGWAEMGAAMLHLVDLDGAFAGAPRNLEVIQAIVGEVDIPVQVGGGIRSMETIVRLLDLGVARVILGTAAISHPDLVAEACQAFGEAIVVGIDSKYGKVAVEGWAATVEKTALELAREVRALGVTRVIYTDTRRDGTMAGPNLEKTAELAINSGLKIIASGGVATLNDIRLVADLEPLGVEGVILGKSLYTGSINLREALAVAAGTGEGGAC